MLLSSGLEGQKNEGKIDCNNQSSKSRLLTNYSVFIIHCYIKLFIHGMKLKKRPWTDGGDALSAHGLIDKQSVWGATLTDKGNQRKRRIQLFFSDWAFKKR